MWPPLGLCKMIICAHKGHYCFAKHMFSTLAHVKAFQKRGRILFPKGGGDMISDVDIDLWLSGVLAENIAELYIAY